jgi:adenylate cyclase
MNTVAQHPISAPRRWIPEWLVQLAAVGTMPSESDDVRLRKATLTLSVEMITLAGFLWGAMYVALGQYRSSIFPFAYSLISILNLIALALWKRYAVFRFIQILAILWLPFLLQWSLGGFVASGAVLVWALLAPIGALLFHGIRPATGWFLAYLVLAVFSAGIEGRVAMWATPLPLSVRVAFFALNVGAVSTVVFLVLRYFVREMEKAQDRSERLLLNILPKPIADRLRRDPSTIADALTEVTVLFADIVDFTKFSAKLSAEELVAFLNEVFSSFDHLADRYGLEKIKTIGDAYMVVGGLPSSHHQSAEAVAEMALRMGETLEKICVDRRIIRLALRIGVHTGPVVAGVIGQKKFIYDLWGDTVNTASRMESQSLPGRIQVTEATFERLRQKFEFEPRGAIEVKGKGPMATYFLLRRSDDV